jgi:hypothetical protein
MEEGVIVTEHTWTTLQWLIPGYPVIFIDQETYDKGYKKKNKTWIIRRKPFLHCLHLLCVGVA